MPSGTFHHRIPTTLRIGPELLAENIVRPLARPAVGREFYSYKDVERPSRGKGVALCMEDCAGAFGTQASPFPHALDERGRIGFSHRKTDTFDTLSNRYKSCSY